MPLVRHQYKYAAVSMAFRYSSKRRTSLQNVTYFIGVHYSLNVRYVTCFWPLGNCNMFKTGVWQHDSASNSCCISMKKIVTLYTC